MMTQPMHTKAMPFCAAAGWSGYYITPAASLAGLMKPVEAR